MRPGLALAAEGAVVAVLARRRDRLADLAERITYAGGSALVVEADITEQPQAAAAVAQVVGELGRLDIVVNNAGADAGRPRRPRVPRWIGIRCWPSTCPACSTSPGPACRT